MCEKMDKKSDDVVRAKREPTSVPPLIEKWKKKTMLGKVIMIKLVEADLRKVIDEELKPILEKMYNYGFEDGKLGVKNNSKNKTQMKKYCNVVIGLLKQKIFGSEKEGVRILPNEFYKKPKGD